MPTPCTICLRSDRAAIDVVLAGARVNLSKLSRTLGVGRKALERHRDRHLPTMLARASTTTDAEHPLAEILAVYTQALDALATAESAVLTRIDTANRSCPPSAPAVAQHIDEARQHAGTLTQLAIDAAEARPPATPLALRVRATLDALAERARATADPETPPAPPSAAATN